MALPFLGLGLSSNAQRGDVPQPYRLLDAEPGLFDYLEYSAPLDVKEAEAQASLFAEMRQRSAQVPLLYHPVHLNLWGPALESAERLAALTAHAQAVGSPWVSNDVGWWHVDGKPLPGYLYLTPPLDAVGLAGAVAHARHVAASCAVPLLLENPVVMTARGEWHVLQFMERLSTEAGCGLLFDAGHFVSHQLTRGLPLLQGVADFPWERVVEVHVAGGVITTRGARRVYVDDHPQPIRDEVWAVLEAVLPRCTAVRALTYEGDGHSDAVARLTLRRLRPMLRPPTDGVSSLLAPPSTPSVVLDAASAWKVFDDVHAGRCEVDAEGARAELDYRLAVVAQHLDAAVPLTRAAVAPGRASLARFVADASFREVFSGGGRSVVEAFARWAMTESRRPELDGAQALMALEVWAQGQAARLAPGASMQARFPMCLVEALHGLQALRRHLGARAWASEEGVEVSGLEGVLHAARRPAPGPWPVVLRRVGSRVDVLDAASTSPDQK